MLTELGKKPSDLPLFRIERLKTTNRRLIASRKAIAAGAAAGTAMGALTAIMSAGDFKQQNRIRRLTT
jgi:hypothetical protein